MNQRSSARPTLVRAEGIHVWDRDGRRYLDATSGAFCAQLGYSRPDLVRAMADAASRLPHARPSLFESEEGSEYSRALLGAIGDAAPARPRYTRVVLTSSGSEAVDVALKAAHVYQREVGGPRGPARRGVRYLAGHYHGATLGALGVTGWGKRRAGYEGLVGPADPKSADVDTTDIAIILETIPAAGLGAPVPSPGYLAGIRARCDQAGALWIADEVLTGFGRVGAMFAWQRLAERAKPDAEAAPDIVVFGKGAGAGYAALAGVILAGRVADVLEAACFRHVQTYGGNPIACAVGRRVLAALHEEAIYARVRALESAFESSLRQALEGIRDVRHIRGMGFLWGIELDGGGEGGGGADAVAARCREQGLLVHAASGSGPEAILLAPPLVSKSEHLEEIAATLRDSILACEGRGVSHPAPA